MRADLFTKTIKQLKKIPSFLLDKLHRHFNENSRQAATDRLKYFLQISKQQYDRWQIQLRHLAALAIKYSIVLKNNTVTASHRALYLSKKLINALAKIIRPVKNLIISVLNKILSLTLTVFRYIKTKFDALIYAIILLTEDAISFVENTPTHAYHLFLFIEKQLNAFIKVLTTIAAVIAIPVNKIKSVLLGLIRYIKGKSDALIYTIILWTEDAISFVENTPTHAYHLFLFIEKQLNAFIKVLAVIEAVIAVPVNKIKSSLFGLIRYIKGKLDALIYSIILLTDKVISIIERIPAQLYQLGRWLKDQCISLVQSLFALIGKIVAGIKNGITNAIESIFKTIRFIKNKIFSLIFSLFKSVKNILSSIKNFFTALKKKIRSRITIFTLKRKLNLISLRKKTKRLSPFERLKQYALLIRLNKPIGILLLLWPTLMALWIAAEGWPDQDVLLVFVAGVFLMRSAGCAINDYADRDIDRQVARTKDRPLTSGEISEKEALMVFAILSLSAFMLVLLMNPLTIVMSFIGLVLAVSYPFMKRHHYLPQVHLGAAFGWAVPMAYTAQSNEITQITWLLFIATVLWATAYDTMYAMVDREDDLKIGVKSTAILFESADTFIIGIIQMLLILCLIMIGLRLEFGIFYFGSVLIATGLAVWQQYLIRDRIPARCFQAFLNNNWFGLVLFIGVFLEYQIGGLNS